MKGMREGGCEGGCEGECEGGYKGWLERSQWCEEGEWRQGPAKYTAF